MINYLCKHNLNNVKNATESVFISDTYYLLLMGRKKLEKYKLKK